MHSFSRSLRPIVSKITRRPLRVGNTPKVSFPEEMAATCEECWTMAEWQLVDEQTWEGISRDLEETT